MAVALQEPRNGTAVGRRLATLRMSRGWTRRELARRAGLTEAAIGHYENGRRRPGAEALLALAEALGVDPREIRPTPARLLGEFSAAASDASPETWSISKVMDYLRCPAYFRFKHVEGVPAAATPEQALGTAVHRGIERLYRGRLGEAGPGPADELAAKLAAELEGAAPDPETGEAPDAAALAAEGKALLDLYAAEVASQVEPLAVEQRVEVDVAGVPFTVVLDLVTADGWVRNTKTSTRRPTQQDIDDNLQATAESLAYRALTGEAEQGVAFDYLLRKKKGPEVAVFTTTRAEADHRRLARVVEGVTRAAAHGHFYPNPANKFGCGTCPFRAACQEAYR